ncbi:MAG: hypothetical protein DWQ31_11275 [Planctomycetota bacterium]|nr:MAG: hypothetical protein DWQ31_11275 [Planctomycetota bacterium]REJ98525.1 MAG: hypothetical protein DWQ35_00550 [Planctomycetota bacterium]
MAPRADWRGEHQWIERGHARTGSDVSGDGSQSAAILFATQLRRRLILTVDWPRGIKRPSSRQEFSFSIPNFRRVGTFPLER